MIKVENVTKRYEIGQEGVYALKDVNITIEEGSFTAVTGTSGSGKTTFLNMVGGLDVPTEGSIYYGEKDICRMKDGELSDLRLNKIGFVFQFFNLIPELTLFENIMLPTVLAKRKLEKEAIIDIAKQLHIEERLTHLPSQVSGGQKQRAAIARALVNGPEILLCDEPTGNLDQKSSEEVLDILRGLHEDKKQTILLVTHDEKISSQCPVRIEISDGKLSRP